MIGAFALTTGPLYEASLSGRAHVYEKNTVIAVNVYVFDHSAAVPEEDDVWDALRDRLADVESFNAVDVQFVADDTVVIALEWPIEALSAVTPPRVTWGVDREKREITLRHEAGESVNAEHVSVHSSDGSGLDENVIGDARDTIEPGDEIRFAVPGDVDEVTLVYEDTDTSVAIFDFTVNP